MAENRAKTGILVPEKRVLAVLDSELRVKRSEDGKKTITGYAAKFGKLSQNLGGFVEKIHENAFDNALKRCDVRALRNHDPDKLLGRTKSGTLALSVDEHGLRYDIAVPETVVGRDTVADIERGDMDGSSFSFNLEDDGDEWDDSTDPPTRTLTNVRDLFDVGPVTYPAYLDTEANCRSFDRYMESRALEQRKLSERREVQALRILKLRLGTE
jgi:HK97 family phage prohead protease